jgi:hypothetical protein
MTIGGVVKLPPMPSVDTVVFLLKIDWRIRRFNQGPMLFHCEVPVPFASLAHRSGLGALRERYHAPSFTDRQRELRAAELHSGFDLESLGSPWTY